MRKKLLALLMCATMVLGSSAVAFAAPDKDDYAAAKKVFSNGSKFTGEYNDQTLGKVTYTTYDKDTREATTWALLSGGGHIKLNSDGDALTPATEYATKDYTKDASGDYYTLRDGSTRIAKISTDSDGKTVLTFEGKASKATGTTAITLADAVSTAEAPKADVSSEPATKLVTNPSAAAGYTLNAGGGVTVTNLGFVAVQDSTTNQQYVAYALADGTNVYYYVIDSTGDVIAKGTEASSKTTYATYKADSSTAGSTALTPEGTKATGYSEYYTVQDLDTNGDGVYPEYKTTTVNGVDATTSTGNKILVLNTTTLSNPTTYAVDGDGYVNIVKDSVSYAKVSKNVKVATADDSATYYVVLSKIGVKSTENGYYLYDKYADTVAYALDDESLSADSLALQVTLYKLETSDNKAYNSNDKHKYLRTVTSVSTSATLTLDVDDFSRTGLKAYENLSVKAIDNGDFYTKDSKTLYRFVDLGTVDATGKISFSMSNFEDSVLVFDGVAVESNNDGVADETATTAAAATSADTAATSPKTGDVAPIAALAVVMMGACGAMVVASKKRA